MRALPLFATALLAALVVAPADARRSQQADAARYTPIPGAKAEDCVQIRQIRETRVRDDSTIDFIMNGNRVYRNTLPNSCPQLGFEEAFSYATSLSQLCSVDIITVLNRAGGGLMRGASCGLGQFVPVARTK